MKNLLLLFQQLHRQTHLYLLYLLLTFFEVITGMAYAAFTDAPVDVAVVEVGLGGSWDATSVATPQVSVVAPISLDHTHILGDSLEKVASEKAGIIKPGAY